MDEARYVPLRDPKGSTTGGQFTANPAGVTYTSNLSQFQGYGTAKPQGTGGRKAPAAPPKAPSSSKFKTLAPNAENDRQAVTEMQQLLTALGVGGPFQTGTYDKATEDAISAIQQRLGIKPNGRADRSLVDKMLAAYDLSPCVKR